MGSSCVIVETLQGPCEKAEGQIADAREVEIELKHYFEVVKQSLKDSALQMTT